jgi:hypothetical protein
MKVEVLLAIVLSVLPLASHAEVVRLRCNDKTPFATTLDIDLDNRTVLMVFDNGWAAQTVPAQIDDRFVTWQWKGDYVVVDRLDRATGHLVWNNLKNSSWLSAGECKRLATKVF